MARTSAEEDADELPEPHEVEGHNRIRPARPSRRQPFNLVLVLWGLLAFLIVVLVGLAVAYFAGAFSAAPRQQAGAGAPPEARQQIEITKRQTFGDWVYLCVKPTGASDQRCSIAQQLADSKSNAPVFLWRILQDGKGGLIGEWQTRSGVVVSQGVVLDAGLDQPIRIPFQTCLPDGCQAVLNLTKEMADKFAKATKASATVFPVGNGNGVQFPLSVNGLSDGLAALKQ